jgi:hypothetical protein
MRSVMEASDISTGHARTWCDFVLNIYSSLKKTVATES